MSDTTYVEHYFNGEEDQAQRTTKRRRKMKISIVIERENRSIEGILEDIAEVVEKVSKKHPDTIHPDMVEVTIKEKR